MSRWSPCYLALLLACGAEAPPEQAPPSARPPSVVLISLDTVRADRLQVYGGRAQTPNLVRLAAGGALFQTAIANFPETALSHWAMLTGALPEVHGDVPGTGGSRYTGPTLAERLQQAGYATGAFIGGETLTDRSTGLSRGFQTYDDAHPWDRADLKRPGDQVVARAVQWIQTQERPWFAFVHLFEAHFPYTPPPPWDTRYDPDYQGTLKGSDADLRPYRDGDQTPSARDLAHVLALYDGEISELDGIIGPLLAAAGPDTLVIVTSDHGESFEHGYWFNHRDGLWDGVVRVPWLVRGPGVKPGHTVQTPVELVDVAPTVLGLLGLPPLEGIHGVDRSAALAGVGDQGAGHPSHSITDRSRPHPQLAIRTGNAKLLIRDEIGHSYDLRRDPGELQPTLVAAPVSAAATQAYRQRLQPVLVRWQGAERPPRIHDPEAIERLRSLGYVDGSKGAGGDPGAVQGPR